MCAPSAASSAAMLTLPVPPACSINTSEPIGGMYINSGRLPAGGEVGVELYPAIATLATYAPKSTITMVIPIDRASFITAVFPTFDKFAEVSSCSGLAAEARCLLAGVHAIQMAHGAHV